jgi:NHL repeat-containing protein
LAACSTRGDWVDRNRRNTPKLGDSAGELKASWRCYEDIREFATEEGGNECRLPSIRKDGHSSPAHLTQWGTQGGGVGQFEHVDGLAVDRGGNVLMTNRDNHRIQKFTTNGDFITPLGSPAWPWMATAASMSPM